MPELPPVEEQFTADGTEFIATLEAIAAAADRAAEAVARLQALEKGVNDALEGQAAAAAAAAAGMGKVAEADNAASLAAAEVAAAAGEAASAERDLAEATYEQTLAQDAAIRASLEQAAADAATAAAEKAVAAEARDEAAANLELAASVAALTAAIDAEKGIQAETAAAVSAAREELLNYAGAAEEMKVRIGEAADSSAEMAAALEANRAQVEDSSGAWAALASWLGAVNRDTFGALTGIRVFGFGLTGLHWIISGTFELLAVLAPAIIALGSAMFVALQGAVNLASHLQAVYTATEATASVFGKTTGDVIGLGHSFQTAQNEANPGVYELLGAYVDALRGKFGTLATAGLQVVHMFDQFAARVTLDMQGALGDEVQGLISHMVTDLQEFGQILGNLGHALLNFAAAMPGLAEVLLKIADGISKVILIATEAGPIITFGMALEEMYRWGGLAMTMLVRLTGQMAVMDAMGTGGFIFKFGAALGTLVQAGGTFIAWIGQLIGRVGEADGAFARAGSAIETFGTEIGLAGTASPLLIAGIAGIIGSFAILAAAIAHVKDSYEQMASSAIKAVQGASDMQVLPTIARNLEMLSLASSQVNDQLDQTSGTMRAAGAATIGYSAATGVGLAGAMKITASFAQNLDAGGQIIRSAIPSFGGLASAAAHLFASFSGATKAEQDLGTLTAAQQKLIQTASTVRSNVAFLAGAFNTTGAAALSLANAAGVNLQQAFSKGGEAALLALTQIINLEHGLGAMSAPVGTLGNDMNVLGIQSQLAGTQVSKLNSAWDAWIASITGGMQALSQFETALGSMKSDAAAASAGLTGSIGSIQRGVGGMTYTLKGFGSNAMQSWQQFTSAVQSGNTVIDQLRTGMAEGVVSNKMFTDSVRGIVGQMAPFTQNNRAAVSMLRSLAMEAGGPATGSLKQLEQWAGVSGKAAKDLLGKGLEAATVAMSNMGKVAGNLSADLSGQVDSAIAKTIYSTSGLSRAVAQYSKDAQAAHPSQERLHSDLAAIADAEQRATTQGGQFASSYNKAQSAAEKAASSVDKSTSSIVKQTSAAAQAQAKIIDHASAMDHAASAATTLAGHTTTLASNTLTAAQRAQQAATNTQDQGNKAATAAGQIQHMASQVLTAGGNSLTAAGKMLTLAASEARAGSSAASAAGQVRSLASAISALQSKTITVTTQYVSSGSASGHAAGTPSAPPGVAMVGEKGPEMMLFHGGEQVFSASQTASILAMAQQGPAQPGGPPVGGAGPAVPVSQPGGGDMVVNVDGEKLFRIMMRRGWKWQTANSGTRSGLSVPGTRVG